MSYLKLAVDFQFWNVRRDAIQNALQRRGFFCYIARRKPPLTDEHNDETFIDDGYVNNVHFTRKANEEYSKKCIIDRRRKNNAWMFCSCFAGIQAGPIVLGESQWNKMIADSYRAYILPEALGFVGSIPTNNGPHVFMHDNAPVHSAASVKQYLAANRVVPIAWPLFSPDLNSIENIWRMMKTYIQDRHGNILDVR
ncbi:hypothetical protein K3495_g7996 [Podosphaera aphanis]|nr:hypothetical protein K3495_g7996 [Podosphaera aphanis]